LEFRYSFGNIALPNAKTHKPMSNLAHQPFTELEVWKQARKLKIEIKDLADRFPPEERYRLSDQLIRASRSVCAAIAEGHGRFSTKDQLHFCIIARGSLSEVLNHLIDALDCKYIEPDDLENFKNGITQVSRLLNGYIAYLRKAQ
jgi:four helix bundle protein